LHVKGPTIETCRNGRGTKGQQLLDLGPQDCARIGTATVGDWTVWSSTPVAGGTLVPEIALQATNATETVALGDVNGAALTMCGKYAYWRIADRASKTNQLRRWRPGLANVEVAFKLDADENSSTARAISFGGCADNVFTIQEMTQDGAGASTTRVWALDSST
jgi:hypothetical protein